jgi:hypothetical protein
VDKQEVAAIDEVDGKTMGNVATLEHKADKAIVNLKADLAALAHLEDLKQRARQALAKHPQPAGGGNVALTSLDTTVKNRVASLKPTTVGSFAEDVDVAEKAFIDDLAKVEQGQGGPDRVAQAKLRADIEALKARAKQLKDWGQADRQKEIEVLKAKIDELLASVPDPDQTVMKTEDREVAVTTANALTKQIDKLERDYHVITSPWFRTHAGSISITPYVLTNVGDQPKFRLDKASGGPSLYAELDFLHRQAWLHPDDRYEPDKRSSPIWNAIIPTDHEIRLRFVNQDQVDSAASTAGGDFQVEGSIGWSLQDFSLKKCAICDAHPELKLRPAGSINLEVNAGISTDRDRIESSRFAQVGLGSAWSFPIQLADRTHRQGTVFSGIYYGVHEFPQLEQDDTAYTVARRPQYNELGALGLKVDFTIPLTQTIEFVAGARYFTPIGHEGAPDDWLIFVGASLPLGRIVRSLVGENP